MAAFRRFLPSLACALAAAASPWPVRAQSASPLVDASGALVPFSPPEGRVVVSERSDFSKYENGAYVGHVYREARLELDREPQPDGSTRYRGEALVLEETTLDLRAVARRIDGAVAVSFVQPASGPARFSEDNGYPILRGVPAPPPAAVSAGKRWTADGSVVVRPDPSAPATRVPVLAEYEYLGMSTYNGAPALALRARYAIRYKGSDRAGDPAMTGGSGSRTADIFLSPEDGSTLFIRETVDETYSYAGGRTIRLKGFILHFHRGSLPADRSAVATLLGGGGAALAPGGAPAAGTAGGGAPVPGGTAGIVPGGSSPGTGSVAAGGAPGATPGTALPPPGGTPTATVAGAAPGASPYQLAESPRGVVLLLFDLRFEADSDRLLAGESGRLDAIAEALKRIPERTFLVEGHAADLGKPAGQYQLSEARAKRIVDEMTARGIPASRFRWRGLGADVPLAPNDTEQGRARNRRVEITVLD